MFVARMVAFVLTILWLWPSSLHAQSDALKEAYKQGLAYSKAGQHEQAIPFYRKALALGEQEYGTDHKITANLLNNLAWLYYNQGNYVSAETLFKRSLKIRENILEPDHPDLLLSLNSLALTYQLQGSYDAAESLNKRALAIREKSWVQIILTLP